MTSVIKKSCFSLTNFNSNNTFPIKIDGAISRFNNQLNIKYVLSNLATIIIPQTNKISLRRYNLWEHTCFEFFLRIKDTTKYWEFNLAPSGNWNVFRFLNYRLNIAEEKAFEALPFDVSQDAKFITVEVNVDLNKIVTANQDLEVAISTVVENQDRELSYWALTHPKSEADFHHQDSFIINV